MAAQIIYEILPESAVCTRENTQLVKFLSGIFPEWGEVFRAKRAWHDAVPIWTAIARFQKRIVGHVAVVERTITTGWNWRYTVASLQGVGVFSDFRGRGIARRLLAMSLAEAKSRSYPFAILFCKEPQVSFYTHLGWKLPDDSMIMWKDRALPIPMRSNCPMYYELGDLAFPEGPIDVHNPIG